MTTRTKAGRKFTAAASVTAIMLGSLSLAGCGGDDEEVPPVQNEPTMDQPAQDPAMGQDPALDQDQTVQNQPVDQQQPIGDPEPADQTGDDERVPGTAPGGGEDPMMQPEPAPTDGTGGGL